MSSGNGCVDADVVLIHWGNIEEVPKSKLYSMRKKVFYTTDYVDADVALIHWGNIEEVPRSKLYSMHKKVFLHHWICQRQVTRRREFLLHVTAMPKCNNFRSIEAKFRKYRGVFKVKSREKTRQIRENWFQQIEHKQVSERGMEPGVRKGKRDLLACHTRCKCSMETTRS